MTGLDFIIKVTLFILLLLQIGLMIYLFIINHKREKEDKKFWETVHKDMETSMKEYICTLDELKTIELKKIEAEESNEQKK